MRNKYIEFLFNIVRRDCTGLAATDDVDALLYHLYSIEFVAIVPNDDNRAEDGKQLRETFIEEEGGQQALSFLPDGPCTLLEMLIGLSLRLEFETAQSKWEKNPSEWFWILIDNLGLLDFSGDVDGMIQNFLTRQYNTDGYGGLFPLKNPQKDQRRIEIWYQMSAYILENYPM